MSRRIAILGASGAVGSTLAVHILRSHALEPSDTLLLVGHGAPTTERKLLSTRIDLMDAFDDDRVQIEMVPDVCDVEADILIVAAGASLSSGRPTRRDLGETNRVVFETIADRCISRLPNALVIVVSNPVELAVAIFSFATDRKRVMGMGAQQDSLRFARAIASDLAVSRHEVRASVMGEHGQAMLPLWQSVELTTSDPVAGAGLAGLYEQSLIAPLEERVRALRFQVIELLEAEKIAEAYRLTRLALPDARIFVEPFITAHSMHSTPNATSNATLQCLKAALAHDHRRIHGQVFLEGDILDLKGVCGIPLSLGASGWRAEPIDWITPEAALQVRRCASSINTFVSEIMSSAVKSAMPTEDVLSES